MRVWVPSKALIFLLLTNYVPWRTTAADAHTLRFKSTGTRESSAQGVEFEGLGEGQQGRLVTEEEISYIASTLQPRECLSLLYLLHHSYKRRRRRENAIKKKSRNQERSAQITPCQTMLLNYWRDPRSRYKKDCSLVSRTLQQLKRQDLARWLQCGRRPSCSGKACTLNGTNALTARLQVIPIYSNRGKSVRTSAESTFVWIIWIYIALAVWATTTVLLCIHCLFQKFRKSSKYIALADKDSQNVQYTCGCIDKRLSLTCNKKKRYMQPPQTGCGCSGN